MEAGNSYRGVATTMNIFSQTFNIESPQDLVRVYNHKKGLHIVVMCLVLGSWRFPWSFRVYRGKGTPSPSLSIS
jgi:hypothetical protein